MRSDPPVLRRLGPVPFWRGEQKRLTALEPIYRRAMENARSAHGRAPSEDKEAKKREEK